MDDHLTTGGRSGRDRPKIAFCLPGTGVGGMERYLLRLLPLVHPHADCWVYVTGGVPGALHQEYAASAITLKYISVGKASIAGARALHREFRSVGFDTVCDLSGIFGAVPLLVAWSAGIPRRIVFHRRSSHAFQPTWRNRLAARLLTSALERCATHILANSHAALTYFHDQLVTRGDPRLAVHRNIIDPAELVPITPRATVRTQLGIPLSAPVVLSVGSNRPSKDYPTLLAAMITVFEAVPEVYCVIAGPGTTELGALAPQLAPRALDRFRFLGARTDVNDLLGACDLFAFPSRTEGMPNALLEAMVVGLPIIASDIPPIREVIGPASPGQLVKPGDADALANSILHGLRDEGTRRSLQRQEHAKVLTAAEYNLLPLLRVLVWKKPPTITSMIPARDTGVWSNKVAGRSK
jgi:glycosyltransferase involved in cell wall biosynthesis